VWGGSVGVGCFRLRLRRARIQKIKPLLWGVITLHHVNIFQIPLQIPNFVEQEMMHANDDQLSN
jgi:hypothetical protein